MRWRIRHELLIADMPEVPTETKSKIPIREDGDFWIPQIDRVRSTQKHAQDDREDYGWTNTFIREIMLYSRKVRQDKLRSNGCIPVPSMPRVEPYAWCDFALSEYDENDMPKRRVVIILADPIDALKRKGYLKLCMRGSDSRLGILITPDTVCFYKDNGGDSLDQIGDELDLNRDGAFDRFGALIDTITEGV